jgi:hypothetical protein
MAFWAAVAAVVVCALATGWFVYGRIAKPLRPEPVQVTVSPDGRWRLTTWFEGVDRLGHRPGVLRVDATDLTDPQVATKTIFVDRLNDKGEARRFLLWRDAEHVSISQKNGGSVTLDVPLVPDQGAPGEFFASVGATAVAAASLLAVLAGGLFFVLLANTWWLRREEARFEAWIVGRSEDRRHATQG